MSQFYRKIVEKVVFKFWAKDFRLEMKISILAAISKHEN